MTFATLAAWEARDWIALAGVIVSPLGAIAVLFLSGRQRNTERDSAERAKARAESATVLGPLLVLLNDAEPYRLAVQSGPQTPDTFQKLWDRWMVMRDSVGVMAATDPRWSTEALQLVVAIDNVLYSGRLWAQSPGVERFKTAAQEDHREAMRQATALVTLVWQLAGGKGEMEYRPRPPDGQPDASKA